MYASSTAKIASVTIGGTAATRVMQTPGPSGQYAFEVWVASNMTGGTDEIAVTAEYVNGVNSLICSYSVTEFSGLASSPLDSPTLAYTSGTTTNPSVTTGAPGAQANELVIAGFTHATELNSAITTPSGWTAIFEEEDGVTKMPGGACYKIVSATTQSTATYTVADSVEWYAGIVGLKAA
jgi:hypothetical protein